MPADVNDNDTDESKPLGNPDARPDPPKPPDNTPEAEDVPIGDPDAYPTKDIPESGPGAP